MFLFKTSGKTLPNVIRYQAHAFRGHPREWEPGELVLVSKNRSDCARAERQIQYTMELKAIRPLQPGEAESLWPGSEGRWKYLIQCEATRRLAQPFNLHDVLGAEALPYGPIMTFVRLSPTHARRIREYL